MAQELGLGVYFYGKVTGLLAEIGRLEQRIARLNRRFATFNRGMGTVEKTTRKTTRATTAATSASKKNQAQTKTAANEMGMYGKRIAKVQGGIQRLTAAMKVTASYGLASAAIFGVINAFKKGTAAIFDFDQALKNLQAITSATDAEIIVLSKTIKQVASTTKYSAQEVSDATILLGQAGFTAAESIDAIDAVAMLATGTLSDMKTTADLLTTAVRAFGLEASDSARISDIFASAVNRSKLTIDKIRTAFNYIGPIAHKAGLSLEETAAGAMVLANAGLRASTIGTGFRQVIARLVAPSDKLRVAFKMVGADLTKLNPAMSDMATIIGELVKVVPTAQRAFQLFGLRGAAAVSALTEAGVEGFKAMLMEVYRVGTATEMAEKQMEGLAVMAKNLMDRLGLLAVAIGEGGIAGAFRVLLRVVRPIVSLLTELADSTIGRVIVAVTSLTAVIITLRLIFRYLAIQLSAIALGYTVANVKMMVAAKGSGLLMVVTTALTATLKRLWLLILANPFGVLVAGISLVVIGIKMWLSKLSEATTMIEANNISIDKHVKALESYKEGLSKIEKGTIKYASIIQRLIKDYPELANQINLTTMEFEDEGKALDALISKKYDEKIKGLINLYDEYGNKIKRATFLNVTWGKMSKDWIRFFIPMEETLKNLGFGAKYLGIAWDKTSKAVGSGFDFIINKVIEGAEKTKEIEALTIKQTQVFNELARNLEQYGVVAGATVENISKALTRYTDKSEDEINNMSKNLKRYLDDVAEAALKSSDIVRQLSDGWVELYNKTDDARKKDVLGAWKAHAKKEAVLLKEAAAYADMTKDKKAAEKRFQADSEKLYENSIKAAAKRAGVQIDIKKRTTERELELVDYFIEQVNVKHTDSLFEMSKLHAKELVDFKGTQEERLRLAIKFDEEEIKLDKNRINNLIALEERRISLASQVYKDQLKNVEEYYDVVKTIAERSHNDIVGMLDTRLKRELNNITIRGLSERSALRAIEQAHEEYYDDIEKESNRHFDALTKITNETYDAIETKIRTSGESAEKQEKELFKTKKKRNDELKKLYQERADAYKKTIDFLISEETRLTRAIKDARNERKEIAKKGDDLIRELGYKLLTDEEKWNAEREHAATLLRKANAELLTGNITDAKAYAEEARGIYAGLAGEIEDESGKVIMSIEETVESAIDGVTESTKLLKAISDVGISALETELGRIRNKINEVNFAFEAFKERIRRFNAEAKLELDASPAIKALQAAEKAVESLIATLKRIPKKIFTTHYITTVYSSSGSSGGDTEADGDRDSDSDSDLKLPMKTPTESFPLSESAFKPISFLDKKTIPGLQSGGHIGGHGSGDKVPTMLEPGEFVDTKSTVRKYGIDFFEALRSKLIPPESIRSLMAGFKMGGMIPIPQKMQAGGIVQAPLPEKVTNIFNIKIAPTIMSGDKTTIRKVAVEFKAALQELDHRWA